MAAGTSAPVEAGQGPGVLNIAATIGAKIRDAAQEAKEEREKAAEKGESPKKGSLFKSSLSNQFNPIKSKKQKSQWAKQFNWNKKSDAEQKVKAPTAGATGDAGKAKLKEFIAGGFTAILQDTGMMVSKVDTMTALGSENLSEVTKSSGTLTVIKETLDAQTELRRKALEEAKFARAEKKLEKRQDVAGVNDPTPAEKKEEEEGEGDGGGGGGGLLGGLLGGLDLLDTGLGIRSLLGGGQAAAGGGAAGGAGLGAGATAGIVGGIGLAMSGLGEGMFQGTRFADQQNQMMKSKGQEMSDAGNPMGMLMGGMGNLGMVGNEFNKTLGAALDVGGAPFRYAIEAAMHPFLNEEQKENQAKNLAKFDGRVREHSRGWMNRIDFMDVISDEKGGFGNIYGNDAANKEMMGKMSSGGIIPLNRGGTIVDDPTRGILPPGSSVIPLNRNVGKKMMGGGSSADMAELPIVGVSAMMLGVASGMLGNVETGGVGDEVKQKIRKASKEFGMSNLTFTSDVGKGSFGKIDPKKDSENFFAKLLHNFDMFGGGSDKKGGGGGGGDSDPSTVPGADLSGTGVNNEVDLAKNDHAHVGKTDVFDPQGTKNTRGRPHMGIDIGTSGKKGYYVGLKKSGKVVNNDYDDISGNWVGIDVGDGIEYRFMHLAHPSPLTVGDDYNGETIGEIGDTGRSSGEHLHFEKVVNGKKVDPSADADSLLDIGTKLNSNFDPNAAKLASSGDKTGPQVTQLAENGGSFNLFNPMSWIGGQGQKAVKGELNGVSNKTLGGKLYNRRRAMEEAMRDSRGYQGGGSRATTRESQRKERVGSQSESMLGLNSGGIPIKGGTFGMLMGMGYPAVFKGREAIRVKLRPGVAPDNEITLGGKRWFGVRQGRDMIYVSHFKANQKNTSLTTGDNVSALAKPPKPVAKETVLPTRPPSESSSAPVVASLPAVMPPVSSSSAEGSFGDSVPSGKTSAMVFADFLYPDLV
jgi:murein DD-endopeptidase MepM/ murein hydrolase activator NlpD